MAQTYSVGALFLHNFSWNSIWLGFTTHAWSSWLHKLSAGPAKDHGASWGIFSRVWKLFQFSLFLALDLLNDWFLKRWLAKQPGRPSICVLAGYMFGTIHHKLLFQEPNKNDYFSSLLASLITFIGQDRLLAIYFFQKECRKSLARLDTTPKKIVSAS